MEKVFVKTPMLSDKPMHYCPGCTHGIIHRLVAEAIDELGIAERAIGVAPIGCAGFMMVYLNCDMLQPAHGRAPAAASAVKRALPNSIVFTYQGDGDLAAIGNAEINNAVARGEKLTTIFINNAIFGMTGGQMAPTTLEGQKTTTTPLGRDRDRDGLPIRVCEMLSAHEGAYYIERVSVDTTANIIKAKKAVVKAFQYQIEGKGYNFVEFLSTCPTNWGMDPVEAMESVRRDMMPYYPLGVFKDKGESV